MTCRSSEITGSGGVTVRQATSIGFQRVFGRRWTMSGLVSSMKHVRYAMGSLTAVLFAAASGAAL